MTSSACFSVIMTHWVLFPTLPPKVNIVLFCCLVCRFMTFVCVCVCQPQDESLLHHIFSPSGRYSAANRRQVLCFLCPSSSSSSSSLTNGIATPPNWWVVFSFNWRVIRSEIEEGLKKLSQIIPAGETYMHEGMKAVSTITANLPKRQASNTNKRICCKNVDISVRV